MSSKILLKKATVFLGPLTLVVLWEIWLTWERAVIEIGLLTLAVVVGTVWYLTLRPLAISQLKVSFHQQEFWRFLITPGVFILAVYLFILITENHFWQQLLIIAANLLFLLVLQNLFDRFHQSSRYSSRSFESISGNINSISLFLLSVIFYSFITFLNMAAWQLALLLLVGTTFLTYQIMWLAGLAIQKSWLYVLVIDLIVVELFWVLLFLPNTFYIKALVITIIYYVGVNLSRNYLIDLLNSKMIWRYLTVGGIILLIALGTAQWS